MSATRFGINVHGGGLFYAREIVADQTGSFVDFGFSKSTKFDVQTKESEESDERGQLIDVLELTQTAMIEHEMMQTRKADVDKVLATKDKYYCGFYAVKLRSGVYQHLFIPLIKVSRNLSLAFGADVRKIPLKVYILAVPDAYITWPDGFDQYNDFPFSLVEDASLLDAPSDDMPVLSQL